MSTKSKILFVFYIIAGLVAWGGLYVSRTPGLTNSFVRNSITGDGELYNMSKVAGFGDRLADPPVPLSERPPKHGINDAEVIVLGDSFVKNSYYGWDVGMVLERLTGRPVFVYENTKAGVHEPPAKKLERLGLKPGSPLRYVLLVHTERFNINGPMYGVMKAELGRRDAPGGRHTENSGDGWTGWFKRLRIRKDSLEFLVTENQVLHMAMVARNTFRFRALGEISDKTPVYSTEPPMLHYYMDVLSDRSKPADVYYGDVADYFRLQSDLIREKYGARVIVAVVPSKYTLCGYDYERYAYNVSGETYNGFIPRLNSDLADRGVLYVDMYAALDGMSEKVYEPHHAHWNFEGMEVAAKEMVRLMEAGRP